MTQPRFVNPVTCPRCKGKGLVDITTRRVHAGVPQGCFKCLAMGVIEGDRKTIIAAKHAANVKAAMHRAAWEILEVRKHEAPYAYTVVNGYHALEEREPERFVKAQQSLVAGHPKVIKALYEYGQKVLAG